MVADSAQQEDDLRHMNLCPHSIPLDDYCPRCDLYERTKKEQSERAALDAILEADGERERTTHEIRDAEIEKRFGR